METILSLGSRRKFTLWRFDASHRRLLLRSSLEQNKPHPTRIDLLFSHVIRINIPTFIDLDTVREVHSELLDVLLPNHFMGQANNDKVYGFYLEEKLVGYVVAKWHILSEDTAKASEKSSEYHINLITGLATLSDG